MKLIQKILIGTDFTQSSNSAVDQAIHISKQFGSAVIVAHIIPEMNITSLSEDLVNETVNKEIQKVSARLTAEGIAVDTIIEKGIPFIQLMKIGELQDVNVIMVGSGSDSNQKMGFTSEKLISKSIKPVWIVPPGAKTQFKKILCAVDFSEASDRALENAIHLSRQYNLELDVMHVMERRLPSVIEKKIGLAAKKSADREEYKKQFELYLTKFDFYNTHWKKYFSDGFVAEEILKQVQSQKSDLLLMGSVGRTAHPKVLTGSTARSVFRTMPTAVISFKSSNIIQLKLENELIEIEPRFQQGIKLLENGFVNEAIAQFEFCLNEDPLYAPAWEFLADAHSRLGNKNKAFEFKAKASEIREKLWSQRVEAEIRNQHSIYKTKNKAGHRG